MLSCHNHNPHLANELRMNRVRQALMKRLEDSSLLKDLGVLLEIMYIEPEHGESQHHAG